MSAGMKDSSFDDVLELTDGQRAVHIQCGGLALCTRGAPAGHLRGSGGGEAAWVGALERRCERLRVVAEVPGLRWSASRLGLAGATRTGDTASPQRGFCSKAAEG